MTRSDTGSSGAGLSVFALIVGLLLMGGAAAAYFVGPRLLSPAEDAPAVTLSTPQELAGLTLTVDQTLVQQATDRENQFAAEQPDATETIGAVYADSTKAAKTVLVVAAALGVDSPADKLDDLFGDQGEAQIELGERKDVADAAAADGSAACAAGTAQTTPLTVCIWADPGSVGVIYFFNRAVEEAEPLFPQLKAGIVSSG